VLAVNRLSRCEGHSRKLRDRFALVLLIFILKDTVWIIQKYLLVLSVLLSLTLHYEVHTHTHTHTLLYNNSLKKILLLSSSEIKVIENLY
jgi:hypothetical protein